MPATLDTAKRWTLKPVDDDTVQRLCAELPSVNPAICRLLAGRGMSDYESAKAFFRPQLDSLHDPFLMKGMKEAVKRIAEAVEWHERILVYGDYDVDGTTAVSVVYSYLRKHYPDLRDDSLAYYIPHRYREGYGVSKQGIDYAKERGYNLLITLDCGIKSSELVKYAQGLGIDVIICDHHLPDDELPRAYAILNPKQPGCPYPYKELSGCGIGFKLVQALCKHWKHPEEDALRYLDLVATSIAADIVPVDGENRVLAYYGLKRAAEYPSPAFQTLKGLAGLERDMTISDLVFVIGPRVNAAGRMDDAKKAVALFTTDDPEAVKQLALELQSNNTDRREKDKETTEQALSQIRNSSVMGGRKSTVVYAPDWHKGVVGIVASRLIDHFYRPTIVLTQSNGKVTGSARSVSGFNIYEALHQCRDLLEAYGGHFYAAGMTMQPERVDAFIQRFEEVVSATIPAELLVPEIVIDAEIPLSAIKPSFYNVLKQFEPFGPLNLRPVFISRKVQDYRGWSKVVKDTHLRFVVHQRSGEPVEGIGFGLAHKYPYVQTGPFDVVYTVEENEFNGNTRLQIKVIDVRPSY
jgi:single-stranded-DNA-specific exonuclease